jgi:hypothetical protein
MRPSREPFRSRRRQFEPMTPADRPPTPTPEAPSPSRPAHRLLARLSTRVEIDWAAEDDRRAVYTLAVLMVLVGALLMYMARGTTFFYDEWAYVVGKYGGGLQSFLEPHNEHFSLIPIAIYKLMFRIFGMRHYPFYRLIVVVMHLICVGLVYDIARRRIGAWPALVAATSILCLFAAWQDLLWAFQMSFVGSAMGGLAAWALIDRDTRRCDIAAGVALAVALSCSGLGIPFVPGIAAELALQRRWRRLWLVAVPLALYLLWYTQYGVNMVTSNTIIQSPQWILETAAAAVGALFGRDTDWGVPITVLFAALAARRFVSGMHVTPRLVGAFVTSLAFWVLTGVSRSTIQAPDESRYLYLGAICVLVVGVELLPKLRANGRAMGVAGAVVLASAAMGWQTLHNNALVLRATSLTVAAQVGAMQLEQAYVQPAYAPSPANAPNINAGLYFTAAKEMDSYAGDSPSEIIASGLDGDVAADAVMVAILAPVPTPEAQPAGNAPAPTLLSDVTERVTHTADCLAITPTAANATVVVTLPPGGAYIRNGSRSTVALGLRRFAPGFTPVPAVPALRRGYALKIPLDRSTLPWYLELGSSGPFSVCGLAP